MYIAVVLPVPVGIAVAEPSMLTGVCDSLLYLYLYLYLEKGKRFLC